MDERENPYAPPVADLVVAQPVQFELATRGERLGGAIIDGIVFFGVLWVLFYALLDFNMFNSAEVAAAEAGSTFFSNLIGLAFVLLVFLIINGYLLVSRAQTVGKFLLNMQIVNKDNMQQAAFGRIVGLRLLPMYVLSIVPLVGDYIGLVDALLIFGTERRCLHDYIAGTTVIKLNREVAVETGQGEGD